MLQNIKSKLQHREAGFTIIEVALVLAIAGLIFLVVFLALPALQKSQRDTARRQDVGRVVSALQAYMADNQGSLKKADGTSLAWGDISGYVGKPNQLTDPTPVVFTGGPSTSQAAVTVGKTCSGNAPTGDGTNSNAAVVVKLETSGNNYCASV